MHLTGAHGSLGEAEHVSPLGVLGAAAALVGRELAIWVDLALEPLEELLAGGAGARSSVVGATPRDFCRDPLVDVLGCYGTSPAPLLRGVIVSVFVSAVAFVRLRADTRVRQQMRQFVRQLLTVRLLGGDRAPAAPADLNRAARLGMLGQVAVQRRAAHPGDAHQLANADAVVGCYAQGEPQRLGSVGHVATSRFLLALLVVLVRVDAVFVPVGAWAAGGLDRAARDLMQLRAAGGVPRGSLGNISVGDEVSTGAPGGVVLG